MSTSSWTKWLESLETPDDWNEIHAAHWGQDPWEGLDKPRSLQTVWKGRENIPRLIHGVNVDPLRTALGLFVFHQYPYFITRILAVPNDPLYQNQPNIPLPPLVITGTPGNGKSAFAIFLVIHLLRLQKTFIYFRGDRYFFFSPNGVKVSVNDFPVHKFEDELPSRLIFILDSDGRSLPPDSVLMSNVFWMIQVASLDRDKYDWGHRYYQRIFVMNPHPVDELVEYFETLKFEHELYTAERINSAVRSFGPNMRSVWSALRWGFTGQQRIILGDINALDENATSRLISGNAGHSLVKTITSAPEPSDAIDYTYTDSMTHVIANQTVWRLLTLHYHWQERHKTLLEMIRRFSLHPESKVHAGWIFESLAHSKILEGGYIKAKRLAAEPSDPEFFSLPKDAPLEDLFDSVWDSGSLPRPQPLTADSFVSSTPVSATSREKVYHMSVASNNATFDAFILDGEKATAFQMTLAHTHSLKVAGLDKLQERFTHHPNKNFVFVVPLKHQFRFKPSAHKLAKEMTFWLLEVDLRYSEFWQLEFEDWGEMERPEEA